MNEEGEEAPVKRTAVGGVMSDGMFCDSKMLGWVGGAAGVAAQIPPSIELGAAPPASKPRPGDGKGGAADEGSSVPAVEVKGLFEKKLTKEEKKKLAEERKKARQAKKAAKKTQEAKES